MSDKQFMQDFHDRLLELTNAVMDEDLSRDDLLRVAYRCGVTLSETEAVERLTIADEEGPTSTHTDGRGQTRR